MITIPIDSWTDFKTIVLTEKELKVQYRETSTHYNLAAAESALYLWIHNIYKDGGADVVDFETNYKALFNKKVSLPVEIVDGVATGTKVHTKVGSDNRVWVDAAITSFGNRSSIDASTTAIVTGNTSGIDADGFGCLTFFLDITAVSGTNPRFQLLIDTSEDNTNWAAVISIPRISTVSTFRLSRLGLGARYYRYRWILTGTSPSFTFSITTTLKNYLPAHSAIVSNYSDVDLTTNGNMSTTFSSAGAKNVSVMTVRAADGGNDGKFKIQGSNNSVDWDDLTAALTQPTNSTQTNSFSNIALRFFRLVVTSNTNAGTRVLDVLWAANT